MSYKNFAMLRDEEKEKLLEAARRTRKLRIEGLGEEAVNRMDREMNMKYNIQAFTIFSLIPFSFGIAYSIAALVG